MRFIFGVGAQKSGTTWLHSQLGHDENFTTTKVKEWHYWDRLPPLDGLELRTDEARFAHFADATQQSLEKHNSYFERVKRTRKILGIPLNLKEIRADITPAYSGLSRGAFMTIREGFDCHRVDYRVIFMVREPVDRIVSAFSMYQRRARSRALDDVDARSLQKQLLEFADSWGCFFRTRYDLTIENLRKSFPADRVLVGALEAIPESLEAQRITDFLGIKLAQESFRQKVNSGRENLSVDGETRLRLMEKYQPTYTYIQQEFPQISAKWAENVKL
jgi:hypothetical protein